ncbi:hypothetical protein NX059_012311 [Plenodomus lindquistii]|nr:hypothetical protein NX059_012311 [Plenodomus lindquistii]
MNLEGDRAFFFNNNNNNNINHNSAFPLYIARGTRPPAAAVARPSTTLNGLNRLGKHKVGSPPPTREPCARDCTNT